MDIYVFNVTIRRSDDTLFTYIRGYEGYTEEASRRTLLKELHECELQIVSMDLREVLA